MKLSRRRPAFSLLEVIATVVLVTVVATATVATIAPMRAKSEQKLIDQQMASLNSKSQAYFSERGHLPPNGVDSLIVAGYLPNDDVTTQAQNAKLQTLFTYDRTTGSFARR